MCLTYHILTLRKCLAMPNTLTLSWSWAPSFGWRFRARGQKHLRYINDFKADYSGIKSKCGFHIFLALEVYFFALGFWKNFKGPTWGLPPKKKSIFFASIFYWCTKLNLQTIGVLIYLCLPTVIWWKSGAQVFLPPPPQWAKIMVHSTLIKYIYGNGQIYEQFID